jgi:hypothetical protein
MPLTNHWHCLISSSGVVVHPIISKLERKCAQSHGFFEGVESEEEPSGRNRLSPDPSPPRTGADQGSKQCQTGCSERRDTSEKKIESPCGREIFVQRKCYSESRFFFKGTVALRFRHHFLVCHSNVESC